MKTQWVSSPRPLTVGFLWACNSVQYFPWGSWHIQVLAMAFPLKAGPISSTSSIIQSAGSYTSHSLSIVGSNRIWEHVTASLMMKNGIWSGRIKLSPLARWIQRDHVYHLPSLLPFSLSSNSILLHVVLWYFVVFFLFLIYPSSWYLTFPNWKHVFGYDIYYSYEKRGGWILREYEIFAFVLFVSGLFGHCWTCFEDLSGIQFFWNRKWSTNYRVSQRLSPPPPPHHPPGWWQFGVLSLSKWDWLHRQSWISRLGVGWIIYLAMRNKKQGFIWPKPSPSRF